MNIGRLFSYEKYRGTYLYLDTQRKYEIARTVIYFAISFAIFFAGYYLTGSKKNLLTVVAVLGMLPASKSLVSAIMFLRYKSCKDRFEISDVLSAYDCIFTTEKINFKIAHLCVSESCIIAYSEDKSFNEKAFKEHINSILSVEKLNDITIKVFTDIGSYNKRIASLKSSHSAKDEAVMKVLMQIIL